MDTLCDTAKKLILEVISEENIIDFTVTTSKQQFSGDNYLGQIARVNITGEHCDGRKVNIHLIVKLSPDDLHSREIMPVTTFYSREVYAYTNILPVFYELQEINDIPNDERFHIARFYKSTLEEFNEAVILQDLSFEGYEMLDRKKAFNFDQVKLVVEYLARFHATSFVLRSKEPKLFEEFSNNVADTINYGKGFCDFADRIVEQIFPVIRNSVHRSKVESFCKCPSEKFGEILNSSTTHPYNVICHGDSWINNILFKNKDGKVSEVVLIDWQLIRLASPITDVAHMIFVSTEQDLRKKHFTELLDFYYKTLENSARRMGCDLDTCYPREVFEKQKKEMIPLGLLISLIVVPFTVKKEGEELELNEIFEQTNQGTLKLTFSEEVVNRVNGICEDFVDMNYI